MSYFTKPRRCFNIEFKFSSTNVHQSDMKIINNNSKLQL